MTSDKSPDKIGSLDQFQIALYASKDKRLSACDLACLFEIVDRFLKDKGITRPTGKAHLERETGRSNGSIKESIRRLIEWEYIRVARTGVGTRGNEYLPNFEWAHRIAATIKVEIRERATAKRKRRSRAENRPTSTKKLVGQNSAPLRNLVGRPTAPLEQLVGRNPAPQTYVIPTGDDYVGISAPASAPGLSAAPVGADFEVDKTIVELTVTAAEVDQDDEGTFIYIVMTDALGGERDDSFTVESQSQRAQDAGQAQLAEFLRALGANMPGNVCELVGKQVHVIGRHGAPKYVPADTWGRHAMGMAA